MTQGCRVFLSVPRENTNVYCDCNACISSCTASVTCCGSAVNSGPRVITNTSNIIWVYYIFSFGYADRLACKFLAMKTLKLFQNIVGGTWNMAQPKIGLHKKSIRSYSYEFDLKFIKIEEIGKIENIQEHWKRDPTIAAW